MPWLPGPGVVELPDGARLRGRGLRDGAPPDPLPEWGLYLLGRPSAEMDWPARWLAGPDFRLPRDAADARAAFAEAHRLALDGVRVAAISSRPTPAAASRLSGGRVHRFRGRFGLVKLVVHG